MKQVFAFAIAAVLLCLVCVFALPATAEAAVVDSGTCGDNLTWTLDDTGTLTISGKGAMHDYSADSPWYSKYNSILKLVIEDGVTSIGNRSFCNCINLTNITIPDSVTSIGDYAFYSCSSLTSITIPNSVTTIGEWALCNCSSLTSITIPNSVTTIGDSAFSGCSSLTSITIPDSVTSIGRFVFDGTAYYDNEDNWTDGVLYIGNHLIEAKQSLFGTYTIRKETKCIAGNAFYGCSGLTSITIPDSVTSIGDYAFRDCGLTSITIPDSVTCFGHGAFSGCSSLTRITIPDSVTSISDFAFSGCSSLTSITIPDRATLSDLHPQNNCSAL